MNTIKILALTLLIAVGCSTPTPPAPTPSPEAAASAARPSRADVLRGHGRRPHAARPTIATPPDTRTPQQIAQAACAGRCAGSQVKPMLASSASTPIIPASWTVPNWYRDIGNSTLCASDKNSGTAATCSGGCSGSVCPSGVGPVRTYAEIAVHRWGTYSPRLQQATVITNLSSDTDGSDPIYATPYFEGGGYLRFTAPLPTPTCSTTLSARTLKNRATPQLLNVTFTTCAGAAPNGYVINTTNASHAWIYTAGAGSSWNMSQPQAPQTVPFTTEPDEVNTWAATNAVAVYTPIKVNLATFEPQQTSYDVSFDNSGYIDQLTIFDPNGAGTDPVFIGPNVVSLDIASERNITIVGSNVDINGSSVGFIDLDNEGIVETTAIAQAFYQFGGIVQGDVIQFVSNDAIIASSGTMRFASIELAYLATGVTVRTSGVTPVIAATTCPGACGPFVWGPGVLDSEEGTVFYPGGGAVAAFLQTGGLTINGQSTACSYTVASPSVINCGITTTPAHFDAAAGVAGFGGIPFLPGGAAFATYGF